MSESPEPHEPRDGIDGEVDALLREMPLRERLGLLSGDAPPVRGIIELARFYNVRPFPAGVVPERGIEGIHFTDGPRGVVVRNSTCFPVSMARGATFDPALEELVGEAIGAEARAQGANVFAGVCVNVLRHPAWGRAQETYGEDPFHLGVMGAALVRGSQRHVMACVKHFACNSIENARFKVDVRVDERTLREVYLPQFRRCVDAGAASIMSAYNRVNGDRCGHSRHLLTEILRDEWGFRGFVMSDFVFGIRDGIAALQAGMDLEMPVTMHFGGRLRRAVEAGVVPEHVVDTAAHRLVATQRRFAAKVRARAPDVGPEIVASPAHRALAREVATRSFVLLQNATVDGAPALPLAPDGVRVALIGRLANAPNLGDTGSSMVRPPSAVTPLEGLRAAGVDVTYDDGKDPTRAARLARERSTAIIVVGYSHRDEGEYLMWAGGDRRSLRLRPADERLIREVGAANPRTVVVLIGGGAIITEAWRRHVPAILMAWYPGMEGGHALADVLLGLRDPGGKLPCVFPRSADHLPHFDRRARRITYGYLHGQRLLDARGHRAAFAFGHGLTYTTFESTIGALSPTRGDAADTFEVAAHVRNTGARAGDEVVQVYAGKPRSAYRRPLRKLVGFTRVYVPPGATVTARVRIPAKELAVYDTARRAWLVEPGEYRLYVGTSAEPGVHATARVTIAE